jgi:hypothetical protein
MDDGMQEHQHIKTVPGEAKAPEVVYNPIRVEEDAHTQTDDINIPLVAVSVAFFAVLMLVLVIGIQAWFYNVDTAERERKILPQGSAGTALGDMLANQRAELYGNKGEVNSQMGKDSKAVRIPITDAMDAVVKQYATAQGNQGAP